MQKILIIEDEEDIAELVSVQLKREGFEPLTASDGIAGLEAAFRHLPDAIILDVMMPEMDGFRVCKRLRQDTRTSKIPILLLTARAMPGERISGLEAGADDYLTKPFSPRELILRLLNLLKRRRATATSELVVGPLRLDLKNQTLHAGAEPVPLTGTELKLITVFLENPGHILQRGDLLREVWGYHDDSTTRTLDTHVKRLREKLGPLADRLVTIRGVGYRLSVSGKD